MAPKNVPSRTGMENTVHVGSAARSRRSTAESASGPSSATVTGRDSTTLRNEAPGACIAATARATSSR